MLIIVATLSTAAQEQMRTEPVVHETAAEQLEAAENLRLQISAAETDEAKAYAVANASATAWVVQSRWPKDDEAVLSSYLLLGAIFREGQWMRNASDSLEQGRGVAKRLGREALIDVRVGEIRHLLRDNAGALMAARAATAALALARLDNLQRAAVLQDGALLLGQLGQHKEASECYTRASKLDLTLLRRTSLLVFAAKASNKAGDRAKAHQNAAAARQVAKELRAQGPPNGDGGFQMLDTLEREIESIEKN
jgi:tetratricopeptide (TPR) repeat protein